MSKSCIVPDKVKSIVISLTKVNYYLEEKQEKYVEDMSLSCEKINVDNIENNIEKLLLKIATGKNFYLGTVNKDFKRLGIGLNRFENQDVYLGEFSIDEMNGNGIFLKESGHLKNNLDVFAGNWISNVKSFGLLMWLCKQKEGILIDSNVMDLFYGEFYRDDYSNGIFISINLSDEKVSKVSIYRGKFIYQSGINKILKNDEECVYYSKEKNRFFYGSIVNDIIKKGKVFLMNSNGKVNRSYECEFDDNKVKSYIVFEDKEINRFLEEFKEKFESFMNVEIKSILDFVSSVRLFEKELNDAEKYKANLKKIENLILSYNSFKTLEDLYKLKILSPSI